MKKVLFAAILFAAAGMARAETIELVTYYPATANSGDLHVRSITVGTAYTGVDMSANDGVALIADQVGIGTNAPQGSLHVVGPDNQLDNILFMPGGGTGTIRMGIGTATPASVLEVQGANTDTTFINSIPGVLSLSTNATRPLVPFYTNLDFRGDQNYPIGRIGVLETGGGSRMYFGTSDHYADGITVAGMVINEFGRVGIGTTAPAYKLHVYDPVSSAIGLGRFNLPASVAVWRYNGPRIQFGAVAQDALEFITNDAVRMYINPSTGNVGIGTDTPAGALQVSRPTDDSAVRIQSGTGGGFQGNARLELRGEWNGDNEGFTLNYDNHGNVNFDHLHSAGNMTFRMRVASTPTTAMIIASNGTVFANVQPLSDVTQKAQIQPLLGALERVTALRGITYRWKDKTLNQEKQIGFSAQEVEKVFPEVVRRAPNGLKTVAYDHLTVALVEAVKEQQREIEKLNERVRELEERATTSR